MRKSIGVISLCIFAPAASAQALVSGNWQGEVTMPDGAPAVSQFRVKKQADNGSDGYKITMFYNERPYEFEQLTIDKDRLTFKLDTGVKYDCKLTADTDGGYSGDCTYRNDGETRHIKLLMTPPVDTDGDTVAKPKNSKLESGQN